MNGKDMPARSLDEVKTPSETCFSEGNNNHFGSAGVNGKVMEADELRDHWDQMQKEMRKLIQQIEEEYDLRLQEVGEQMKALCDRLEAEEHRCRYLAQAIIGVLPVLEHIAEHRPLPIEVKQTAMSMWRYLGTDAEVGHYSLKNDEDSLSLACSSPITGVTFFPTGLYTSAIGLPWNTDRTMTRIDEEVATYIWNVKSSLEASTKASAAQSRGSMPHCYQSDGVVDQDRVVGEPNSADELSCPERTMHLGEETSISLNGDLVDTPSRQAGDVEEEEMEIVFPSHYLVAGEGEELEPARTPKFGTTQASPFAGLYKQEGPRIEDQLCTKCQEILLRHGGRIEYQKAVRQNARNDTKTTMLDSQRKSSSRSGCRLPHVINEHRLRHNTQECGRDLQPLQEPSTGRDKTDAGCPEERDSPEDAIRDHLEQTFEETSQSRSHSAPAAAHCAGNGRHGLMSSARGVVEPSVATSSECCADLLSYQQKLLRNVDSASSAMDEHCRIEETESFDDGSSSRFSNPESVRLNSNALARMRTCNGGASTSYLPGLEALLSEDWSHRQEIGGNSNGPSPCAQRSGNVNLDKDDDSASSRCTCDSDPRPSSCLSSGPSGVLSPTRRRVSNDGDMCKDSIVEESTGNDAANLMPGIVSTSRWLGCGLGPSISMRRGKGQTGCHVQHNLATGYEAISKQGAFLCTSAIHAQSAERQVCRRQWYGERLGGWVKDPGSVGVRSAVAAGLNAGLEEGLPTGPALRPKQRMTNAPQNGVPNLHGSKTRVAAPNGKPWLVGKLIDGLVSLLPPVWEPSMDIPKQKRGGNGKPIEGISSVEVAPRTVGVTRSGDLASSVENGKPGCAKTSPLRERKSASENQIWQISEDRGDVHGSTKKQPSGKSGYGSGHWWVACSLWCFSCLGFIVMTLLHDRRIRILLL